MVNVATEHRGILELLTEGSDIADQAKAPMSENTLAEIFK